MPQPSITETVPGDFAISGSAAFVVAASITVAAFGTATLAVQHPAGASPQLLLTPEGQATVDLAAVPAEGLELAGRRLTVAVTEPLPDVVRLTCNISDEAGSAGADRWELRAGGTEPVEWRLLFGNPLGVTVHHLLCDPRAEILVPPIVAPGMPLVLAVADPSGPAGERTAVGDPPPELAPIVSWRAEGPLAFLVPPSTCGPPDPVVIGIPPIFPAPMPLLLSCTVTFGGSCPANTAFLESSAGPVPVTVLPLPHPIGFLGDLSGRAAPFVQAARAGAELAVAAYNAADPQVPVRLVDYDTRGDPARDEAQIVQATADGAVAMICPTFFDRGAALPDRLEAAAIPGIDPCGTRPDVTGNNWRYWHRMLADDTEFAEAVVGFLARTLQPRSAFTIHEGTAAQARVAAATTASFRRRGAAAGAARFDPRDPDLSALLARLREARPDVIVHCGAVGRLVNVLRQAHEFGLTPLVLTADLTGDPDLSGLFGFPNPLDGLLLAAPCVLPEAALLRGDRLLAFLDECRRTTGAEPARYVTAGHDAATALLAALGTGAGTAESVADALATLDVQGLTGRIRFAATGAAVAPPVFLYRVRRGAITLLGTAEDAEIF
jgi:branched-chain amino acid transport system substrate-binding protein